MDLTKSNLVYTNIRKMYGKNMNIKHLLQNTVITVGGLAIASCGGGGGNGSTVTPPAPPAPDTQAPSLEFSPSTLTVVSTGTGSSTLSATDNVGITTGPDVSCTNGGDFSNGVFTAPATSETLTSECTATASDAAGNEGSAILTVTVEPDTTAPVVSFSVASITVNSGQTSAVSLTATDDAAVTSLTTTCTNGGSFSDGVFSAPTVTITTNLVCTATATDAAGNSANATLNVTVEPLPDDVKITGKITYDLVPLNTSTNGLNYGATVQTAAPGLTVEARDANGNILDSDVTDSTGDYLLTVLPNTDVQIVAKAEMLQAASAGSASWDVKVVDNTNSGAIYELTGSLSTSGGGDSTRNLNAESGWGGSSYTSTRASAPFAMLAPTYVAIQKMIAGDPDAVFPVIGA